MRGWIGIALLVAGCSTLTFTERKELFRVVSVDHSCNESEIEVISEETDREAGTGEYMLEVCGSRRKYRLEGDTFYDASARAREENRREGSKKVIEASEIEVQDDELPPS